MMLLLPVSHSILAVLLSAAFQMTETLPTLTAVQRDELVGAIASQLRDRYVNPADGARVARVLDDAMKAGAFNALSHPDAFGAAVNALLQRETRDRHLYVWYPKGPSGQLQFSATGAAMVGRAEILPDRIGYLEVRHFVGETAQFDSAMEKLQGVAAIVVDLRQCVGGNREQVAHLWSYFVAKPTRLLIHQGRTDPMPIEQLTLETVPAPRLPDVPAYVLTSSRSFSAAESFALGRCVAGRAVIVGERTAGGGHYVQGLPALPHGFRILLSVGRNLDPRTGQTWEGQGIAPDVAVPAELALQAAVGHFFGSRALLPRR